MDKPLCCTCAHWSGSSLHYSADCRVNAYGGRTTFDMTCSQHSAHAAAPTMQSQARGDLPWLIAKAMAKP